MRLSDGLVTTSPKLIFVVDMGVRFLKEDLLELLKKDVLVEELEGFERHLERIQDLVDPYTGFLINIDPIFHELKTTSQASRVVFSELLGRIRRLSPGRTLVFTSQIHPDVAYMFRSEGIGYIEKRIFDRHELQNIILNVVPPFFAERNRLVRNYLRVSVEERKIPIKLQNIHDGTSWGPPFEGILKNLSLNGLNVVLREASDAECFVTGDTVFVDFFLENLPVRISRALVSRVIPQQREVCLYFDIDNPSMINDRNAGIISQFFYSILHRVISLKTGL